MRTASLLLGVGLLVVGCLSSSLGMLCMKLSSKVEADRPFWRRPRWAIGFLLLVVTATAVDLVAFGMLPLSMIAPFAGLTIAFSLLLAASGLLGAPEPLQGRDIACMALILAGITIVSTYGPHTSAELGYEELLANFTNRGFMAFASAALLSVTILCDRSRIPRST